MRASDVYGLTDADLLRAMAFGEAAYREAVRRGLVKEKATPKGGQFNGRETDDTLHDYR